MSASPPPTGSIQRKIKSAIAAVVIAASTMDVSFAFADTSSAPITRSVLEQSIQTLEASNTRSEVIQSLADVFEAAGTKTLLVRTKYKYVSIRHNRTVHFVVGVTDQTIGLLLLIADVS